VKKWANVLAPAGRPYKGKATRLRRAAKNEQGSGPDAAPRLEQVHRIILILAARRGSLTRPALRFGLVRSLREKTNNSGVGFSLCLIHPILGIQSDQVEVCNDD